jgi:hypothetical protein
VPMPRRSISGDRAREGGGGLEALSVAENSSHLW